jgi:protocatechuate 3,4-dioxygenase beta subunit
MKNLPSALFLLTAALILALGGWWMAGSGTHESEATPRKQSLQEPAAERGAALEPVTSGDTRAQAPAPFAEPSLAASLDEAAEVASTLTSGPTLSGRVVDEQGFTVAGAEVRIWTNPWSLGDPVMTVVSAANGEFSASGFGPKFVAAAFSPDMVCVSGLRGDLAEGTVCEGLELVLARAHAFVGTVVGAGDAPIEGAVLELGNDLGTSSSRDATDTPGVLSFGSIAGALTSRQVTGADGRFEFSGVQGDGVSVRVEAVGHVGRWFSHSPATGPATIDLDPGRVLSGLVLDADGRPAAGAEVRFGPLASNLGVNRSSTMTDETGRFSVSGLGEEEDADASSAPIFLAALHEGHSVTVLQPAALDAGGQGNVLRLERAAPLTGRVVDGEGRPVHRARVSLRSEREYERSYNMIGVPPTWESLFSAFRRTTEDDGCFQFPHRHDGPSTLKVEVPGRPRRSVTVAVRADESEVEVRLSDEALDKVVLEGRLVDRYSGEPIERFRLLPWSDDGAGTRTSSGTGLHRSAPDGSFRVAGLEEAELEFEFRAEGYTSLMLSPRTFEEGVHDLGELRMTPAIALRVEVLDEAGEPWSGGTLMFEDAAGKPVQLDLGSYQSTGVMLTDDGVQIAGVSAMPLTAVVLGKGGTRWEQPGVDPRSYAGQTLTLVVPRPKLGSLQVTFLDRASLGADADRVLGGFRQAIATMDQGWLMENREVLLAAFPKQGLQVRLVRGGADVGSGEVAWLPDTGTYRTSATAGSNGSSSEGSPFPDLRWSDLPTGEYEIVVTTESGTTTTRAAAVHKAAEGDEAAPPIVVDY